MMVGGAHVRSRWETGTTLWPWRLLWNAAPAGVRPVRGARGNSGGVFGILRKGEPIRAVRDVLYGNKGDPRHTQ